VNTTFDNSRTKPTVYCNTIIVTVSHSLLIAVKKLQFLAIQNPKHLSNNLLKVVQTAAKFNTSDNSTLFTADVSHVDEHCLS